jgi:hypothetical protein
MQLFMWFDISNHIQGDLTVGMPDWLTEQQTGFSPHLTTDN